MTNDQKKKELEILKEAIEKLTVSLNHKLTELVGLHQEIEVLPPPAKPRPSRSKKAKTE